MGGQSPAKELGLGKSLAWLHRQEQRHVQAPQWIIGITGLFEEGILMLNFLEDTKEGQEEQEQPLEEAQEIM